jgi:hypothetical protein
VEDLAEALTDFDPMTAVFELNAEMMKRTTRIRFFLTVLVAPSLIFALLLGLILALVVWDIATDGLGAGDPTALAFLVIGFLFTGSIAVFGSKEIEFLTAYRVMANAVNRAKSWDPHPPVPSGDSPITRLLAYLTSQDDRIAYFASRKPKSLKHGVELEGEKGSSMRFALTMNATSQAWDKIPDGMRLLVRTVEEANIENVTRLREDAKVVLKENSQPARIIMLQSTPAPFSDALIEFVNENLVEYPRMIGGEKKDWSSPVELIAEDGAGKYRIGSFYFG